MKTLLLITAVVMAHISSAQVTDLDIVNSLLGKNAFAINKTLDSLKVWYYQHYDTQQGATGVRDLKKHYSIANSEGSVKLFSFSSSEKNIIKEITVNYRHDSKDQVEDLKKIKNFVDIHVGIYSSDATFKAKK